MKTPQEWARLISESVFADNAAMPRRVVAGHEIYLATADQIRAIRAEAYEDAERACYGKSGDMLAAIRARAKEVADVARDK